jgi:hypothetical protein
LALNFAPFKTKCSINSILFKMLSQPIYQFLAASSRFKVLTSHFSRPVTSPYFSTLSIVLVPKCRLPCILKFYGHKGALPMILKRLMLSLRLKQQSRTHSILECYISHREPHRSNRVQLGSRPSISEPLIQSKV